MNIVWLLLVAKLVGGSSLKKQRTDGLIHQDYHNISEISIWYGERFGEEVDRVIRNESAEWLFSPSGNNASSQLTPHGRFELGKKIASSVSTAIFSIKNYPEILIKFQANCIQINSETNPEFPGAPYVHPLIRDYIFGGLAAQEGLAPEIFYISPPSPLCRTKSNKCDFSMTQMDFIHCQANPRASLRYMIIRRVKGPTLWDYKNKFVNGTVPFGESVLIGYALIQFLQELHQQLGIIHGDIHASNVMMDSIHPTNGSVTLGLIDFGRSVYNSTMPETRVRRSEWSRHYLFSMWELDGFRSAARDDVARAVQAIAQLMHPWKYLEVEIYTGEKGSDAILGFKRNSDWFSLMMIPGVCDVEFDAVENLNISIKSRAMIRNELGNILRLVKGMNSVNSVPPYEAILSSLHQIFRLQSSAKL